MRYVWSTMQPTTSRDRIRGWIEEVIHLFGPDEAGKILSAASERLEQQGGGTAKDWYAAIQAAIIERHPDVSKTSHLRLN